MELELSQTVKKILSTFLLLILPLLIIVLGLAVNLLNAWFYILAVTWFCSGIIFFWTINSD